MKNIIVYHNARCSKSRGVCELLQKKKKKFQVVEYLKTPPTAADIKALLKMLELKAKDIVRSNEPEFQPYLDKKLTSVQLIALMVKHPILIQRPIVIIDGKAIIARPPESVNQWL